MARLPSAYQEVEYIESDGSQCINTGLTANIGLKYYVKWMNLTGGSNSQGILGEEFTWNRLGLFRNGYTLYSMVIANGPITLPNPYDIIHEVTFDYPKFVLDNEEITLSGTGITSTGTVYLFKMGTYYSNIRIYANKWWDEQGNLVRDYIPVKRKSDNIVGMYDVVNGLFYANENQGNFIAGPEINTQQVITTYKDIISSKSRLPSGYQEVEYIQSDGGQYIGSEVVPSNATTYKECMLSKSRIPSTYQEVEYIYAPTSQSNNYFGFITGIYQTHNTIMETDVLFTANWTDAKIHGPFGRRNDCLVGVCVYPTNTFRTVDKKFNLNQKYHLRIQPSGNNTAFYIDNELGTTFGGIASKVIRLYHYDEGKETVDQDNKVYNVRGMYMYETKFWEGTTLTHDYVPCYVKATNEYGLYDLVDERFLSNDGNGTFAGGPNIYNIITTYKECVVVTI